MKQPKNDYVKSIDTYFTGGGCTVDVITLTSGQVISLNDECLVVHDNYDQMLKNFDGDYKTVPTNTKAVLL